MVDHKYFDQDLNIKNKSHEYGPIKEDDEMGFRD
jgi:hypothetical protein